MSDNSVDNITVKLGDLTTTKPIAPAAASETTNQPSQEASSKGNDETPSSNLIKSNHDVQVKLADQQADPNSPLFSVKSFEELGLHPDLLKGLYAMGFSKPSKIQERALPLLLSIHHVI